jgi:hypothetical protein
MKLDELFPRKYATGEDLQGRPVTLTISHLHLEKMTPTPGAAPVEKWVIFFKEAQKGIVLSKTLAIQVAQAVGSDDTDAWTGKRVTLFPESVTVAGQARIAIRAKIAQTPAAKAA